MPVKMRHTYIVIVMINHIIKEILLKSLIGYCKFSFVFRFISKVWTSYAHLIPNLLDFCHATILKSTGRFAQCRIAACSPCTCMFTDVVCSVFTNDKRKKAIGIKYA